MEAGSIVEAGTHLELMTLQGRYYNMVETSMKKADISALVREVEI